MMDTDENGYSGACYACEPVGELNVKLTAEIAELEEKLKSQESHIVEEVTAMFRVHTAKAKADAIREMAGEFISLAPDSNSVMYLLIDEYADNLEQE